MRLLHGSNVEIVHPDLKMCQSMNDYGRGFYLTPQWQRAYLMAKHGLKVKEFKGFSAEWSKFIILNRSDETFSHDYDVVIGPVADAFVDREIERHRQKYGIHYLDTEALLDFAEHVSQFGDKYTQFCFCTERALKELIKE